MSASPAVIIPSHSSVLESVAVAVSGGVSEGSDATPCPLVVADASAALGASSDAPIVFVGWHGDEEESRRLASEILATLARRPPRPVALFETRLSESSGLAPSTPVPSPRECPGLRFLGSPEQFMIRRDAPNHAADPNELARARQWAARVYRRWRSNPHEPPSAVARRSEPASANWSGWCGAFE